MTPGSRKAQRTREIREATRTLFDSRGTRDAHIDDIAKAVGVNRAIIYRHFSTKEELFAMTLVDYLNDLEIRLSAVRDGTKTPVQELRTVTDEFFDFGIAYPAFVDCAQALLRFRGADLVRDISSERIVKLNAAMNNCVTHLEEIFTRGNNDGSFHVQDPTLLAHVTYTQGLGFLSLLTFQRSVHDLDVELSALEPLPVREATNLAKAAIIALATSRAQG